jgi:hypothetical protein
MRSGKFLPLPFYLLPLTYEVLLHELNYGYKTENWFKLRILGELWVMPANSFDAQKAAVEQFKFERN